MSWDCSGRWRRHQHRPVLTDSAEEDLHWGRSAKYLHKSLWPEMLLLHLSESHDNCGDRGTGGPGDQTGETSLFWRGCWAEHRASSDFSLSAITFIESVEPGPSLGQIDHVCHRHFCVPPLLVNHCQLLVCYRTLNNCYFNKVSIIYYLRVAFIKVCLLSGVRIISSSSCLAAAFSSSRTLFLWATSLRHSRFL